MQGDDEAGRSLPTQSPVLRADRREGDGEVARLREPHMGPVPRGVLARYRPERVVETPAAACQGARGRVDDPDARQGAHAASTLARPLVGGR